MLLRDRCQEVVQTWSRLGPVLEGKTKVQLSYSPLALPSGCVRLSRTWGACGGYADQDSALEASSGY